MAHIEGVRIDILDMVYEGLRDVETLLDRDHDLYDLPRGSVEGLGEADRETGGYDLIGGRVEAMLDEPEVDGVRVPVWSVGCDQLTVRPAAKSPA
jgi:hypothetical protein